MSQNTIAMLTYAIAMTAENAPKIDQINKILLGAGYTATTDTTAEKSSGTPAKTAATSGLTMAEVKDAARAGKKEHGEDFCQSVISSIGGEVKTSIGRSLSALTEDQYAAFIEGIKAGPQDADTPEDDDFGDDDDDFGDDDEADAPDPETVQAALKAKAKDDRTLAKKIMSDNGAASLSKVPECTPAQLSAMMKALV